MADRLLQLEHTFTGVGSTFTYKELEKQPSRFRVDRARVEVISGSATKVAFRLAQRQSGNRVDSVLEYSLSLHSPSEEPMIDSLEEGIIFFAKKRVKGKPDLGSVFLAVRCDQGTDNTVKVVIDMTAT